MGPVAHWALACAHRGFLVVPKAENPDMSILSNLFRPVPFSKHSPVKAALVWVSTEINPDTRKWGKVLLER